MAETWGPWIEHDGKGCPIRGLIAEVTYERTMRRGDNAYGEPWRETITHIVPFAPRARSWDWSNWPKFSRVIRYRVRQFSALTDLKAICENPQPVREDA